MTDMAQFGPRLHADGVTFRLWAPNAKQVELLTDRPRSMTAMTGGWYELTLAGARARVRYKFRIDGALDVPDPASHFQPDDVSDPSEVIDHQAYQWRAQRWRGRPWQTAVFLECHVGAFTPEGNFVSMIKKLDHVVACGLTAIELMPLADFAGRWNWGYDGVLLYAPDSSYGRPEDLKTLIDEAHLRGLMVFLDVVYNHFGPEGNYLGRYAPAFFTSAHTPWGAAIDYRVPEVRAFAIENALHWLRDYRFDGLRLDAVHAITEPGAPPFLEELSRVVGEFSRSTDRLIHLVLENDNNQANLLDPLDNPPRGRYRAQWNDDFHHACHVCLTGEDRGYYIDYAHDTRKHIARTLSSGFSYQGESSERRGGRKRGEPSATLSPLAFINFLQNHDQIGNRPLGERLTTRVAPRALAAAVSIMLLAPMPPLLFMGEEWDSERPFPFFCDFEGMLAEAVRAGRRKEFRHDFDRHAGDIPDPLAEDTFRSAKLDWDALATSKGRSRLELVRNLLAVRKAEIIPHLTGTQFGGARLEGQILSAHWQLGNGTRLSVLANLSDHEQPCPEYGSADRPIFGGALSASLAPYAVHWMIGDA
jgi:maltooligosyltrehalose trehalohydrolase